jgi:uncharacterized protein YqhQ
MSASSNKKMQDASVMGAMIAGLVLGVVIFNYLPIFISTFASKNLGLKQDWQINLLAETLKIGMFLGYIALISLMPEIKRLFRYHGAEHKAINVLENDLELNMENCLKQTRLHPRCGTSFAIIVLLVGLVVFTFLPRPHNLPPFLTTLVRFAMEIPLLFFIAGISYELLRFAGKNRNNTIVKLAFGPGLLTQFITTKEPDESQIEVALVALQECMAAEEAGAAPEEIKVIGEPTIKPQSEPA